MKVCFVNLIITIFLFSVASQAAISVSIDGAVAKKGSQKVENYETLWALMCKSNFSDIALLSSVLITRKTSDGLSYYKINLKKLMDKSLDFKLKEGDEIFVPERDAFLPLYAKKAILVE